MTWHVWRDAVGRPGAENMAIDEALLADAGDTGRAWLRLYRWSPPCLSLGRNEPALSRYDRAAIDRLEIPVVRRPTGGRAVWHDREVTYAVAAPLVTFGSLRAAYRAIHERLARALRSLGADVTLAPARPPATVRESFRAGPGACFAAPVGGEILVGGSKVVGSAQVRCATAFLQHGSILLDGSQDVIRAVSRQPSAVSRETTLSAALGRTVSFDEVVEMIAKTWSVGALPAEWSVGAQHAAPLRPAALPDPPRPSPSAFANPVWTWRR